MNLARLTHLRTVMRQVAEQRLAFDMNTWADHVDKEDWSHFPEDIYGSLEATCGTTCCALGWAALDPKFQEQGLQLSVRISADNWRTAVVLPQLNALLEESRGITEILYHSHKGAIAAEVFFDISYDAAQYLFMGDAYGYLDQAPSPDDVIAHIDEVIALGGYAPGDTEGPED